MAVPITTWAPSTAYAVGAFVTPPGPSGVGYYFEATAVTGSAKSGAFAPPWNVLPAGQTPDGNVVWTCAGAVPVPSGYTAFQVGNALQPIPTTGENSLLQDADPALFYALDFWAYVIGRYPGPRLLQALAAANVTSPGGTPIAAAVAQSYPYEPLPEQLENQFQFPLLAAYRRDATTALLTASYEHDVTTLEVLYVLPPLDAAATERILPIFKAVAQALRKKTTDAWDPGYAPPGGPLGAQFDSEPFGNVEEIGFGEYGSKKESRFASYGYLEAPGGDGKGLYFPCLRLSAYVVERDNYVKTGGTYQGADLTAGVAAPDGTVVSPVAQQATQLPPTLANLSAVTGPYTGGTSVTLTGTLFLGGQQLAVYFGGYPATNVVRVSSTSITCTTPAMLGAGVVGVQLQNGDGQQSNALPASFTFT